MVKIQSHLFIKNILIRYGSGDNMTLFQATIKSFYVDFDCKTFDPLKD